MTLDLISPYQYLARAAFKQRSISLSIVKIKLQNGLLTLIMLILSHGFLLFQTLSSSILQPTLMLCISFSIPLLFQSWAAPSLFHFSICTISQLFLAFFPNLAPSFLAFSFLTYSWLFLFHFGFFFEHSASINPHIHSTIPQLCIQSQWCLLRLLWHMKHRSLIGHTGTSGLNGNISRYSNMLIYMVKLLNTGMILTVLLSSLPRNIVRYLSWLGKWLPFLWDWIC